MKRLLMTFTLCLVVILFGSCFGIQMGAVFDRDGSGTMTLRFRVSHELLEMGAEQGAEMGIPLTRRELEESFHGVEGVTVREAYEEETGDDRIVTAVLDFTDFNAMAARDGYPAQEAELVREGGRTVFRTRVGNEDGMAALAGGFGAGEDAGEDPEMAAAMAAMVQAFMEGYTLEYRITAPIRVERYSHGELTDNGRTVVMTMPMGALFLLEEPFVLEIAW